MRRYGVVVMFVVLCVTTVGTLHSQIIILGAPPEECDTWGPDLLWDPLDISCEISKAVQWWTTVSADPNAYLRLGRFRIVDIERGVWPPNMPFDDGDWRIDAVPLDDASRQLLTNAQGHSNWNDEIELEIMSYFPLDDFFQIDDEVTAYGWHTEDWGHGVGGNDVAGDNGGKTELHPIIYLQSGALTDEEFQLFAAQDGSDRFPIARESLWKYFSGWTIPLPRSTYPLDLGSLLPGDRTDDWSLNLLSARWRRSHGEVGYATVLFQQIMNSVVLAPRLPGEPIDSDKDQTFWFFGQFQRSTKQALHQEVSVRLDGGRAVEESIRGRTQGLPSCCISRERSH